MSLCPCGSETSYEECCGPFHSSEKRPETAEKTMRSRYSAFVKGEVDYILDTHDPSTVSEINRKEVEQWSKDSEWKSLEIVRTEGGGENDTSGVVEFVASYSSEGQDFKHHEKSDFVKKDGRWFFHDGNIIRDSLKREGPKVGRNDPCPCGSGKKYKKCCL